MPTIKVQKLPNGWYACRCSDSAFDFWKADALFASALDAYVALYPYRAVFDVDWPGKEDKLEEKARKLFNLKEK